MAQQDPAWSSSTCGLGVTGSATFDPGAVAPRELLYFVAVGTDGVSYGSFGRNSSGAERPTTLTASSTTPLFERPRPAAAALRLHAAPPARSDRSYQMEPCP
jgi:hypothetical protein